MGSASFTIVRGDDYKQPFTITLDQSRSLDGTESWTTTLRESKTSSALLVLSSPSSGIEVEASGHATRPFQPTLVFTPADYANLTPDRDQDYHYDLQMTKDGKFETPVVDIMTVRGDLTR